VTKAKTPTGLLSAMVALFSVVAALDAGCNRPGAAPGATSTGPVEQPADVLRIRPRARFKLPHERSSDIWGARPQLSADGKRLAVGCKTPKSDWLTQVWSLSGEPKVIAEFDASNYILSPSGKLLLTSQDSRVFDVDTKKQVAQLPTGFSHGAFLNDQIVVATKRSYHFPDEEKGRITIWNVALNHDAGSFDVPDNRFNEAVVLRERNEVWLFMAHHKFEVECYSLRSHRQVRTVKPEQDESKQPYYDSGLWNSASPDGQAFAAKGSGWKVSVFDASSGRILARLPPDLYGTDAGFVPGGSFYLATPTEKCANRLGISTADFIVYDWQNGREVAVLTGHAADEKDPLGAVSDDGRTLVSAAEKGEVMVFDLSPLK
jgi:WD40 repeat protein